MRYIDAKRDHFRILARQKGYRSRSAFKLIQLNEKYNFLTNSKVVVDLGCSPGGWLQVITRYVKESGMIVGVDINSIDPLKNITFVRKEVGDPKLPELLLKIAGSPFDLVLSDLAPKVSGIWEYDQARQISISLNALGVASRVLRLGGNAVFKLFEGEMMGDFKKEASKIFANTFIAKPKASRQQSSEIYIICKAYCRVKVS